MRRVKRHGGAGQVDTVAGGRMMSYFRLTASPDGHPPMEKTRLSSKGQLVLPKALRDARNWGEGTEFVVESVADGVLLRPAPDGPE